MRTYPLLSFRQILMTLFFVLPATLVQADPPGAKQITEGRVNYKVDAKSLDPAIAQFLQNLSMVVYFSGDQLRVDMNMGLLGTTTTIADAKTGKTVTLMNMMGNKLAVNEIPEEAKELIWTAEPTEVVKTIAGYECRKTLVKSSQTSMVYCVTDKIAAPKVRSEFQLDIINGFPLEIDMTTNGFAFTMIATGVFPEPVPASRFSQVIPDGYELMTPDEMLQMLGGMMGQ